jgi:hypothetical protein
LAELAGYLCATVEFPRPAFMLSTGHNSDRHTSLGASWNDYVNLTFQQDGMASFVDLDNIDPQDRTHKPNAVEIYTPGNIPENWMRFVTRNPSQVVDHFLPAEATSFRQPGKNNFIWIWNSEFF